MNRSVKLAAIALMAVNLGACATIVRGTNQEYVINTNPEGVNIELSTGQTCRTPCTLRLPRKHHFTVTAQMDGYETAQAEVRSVMRGGGGAALAGNAVFGGLIGAGIDASNGSLNSLTPNPLTITMVRVGEGMIAAATAPADAAAAPEAAPVAAEPAQEAPPAAEPVPTAAIGQPQ